MKRLAQFCWRIVARLTRKTAPGDAGHRAKRLTQESDKVSGPKPPPRRAGPVWPSSCGIWLGRTASMVCAKPLAPEPDLTGRMGQPLHNSLYRPSL
ncbi:hypothetical protein [Luteithermobacter gelatinilyticus]|uniref:hypothetical protein n=1 Tax=Luteithermobacter gelatinilyticus TaxID=2582913 RepID=UPI001105D17B|nr:hypothetical protein [Luteithermobacter gelatinilyticus]